MNSCDRCPSLRTCPMKTWTSYLNWPKSSIFPPAKISSTKATRATGHISSSPVRSRSSRRPASVLCCSPSVPQAQSSARSLCWKTWPEPRPYAHAPTPPSTPSPKSNLNTSSTAAQPPRRVLLNTVLARWRTTDAALHQSEKMAQLGTLMAGVAHELNNPAAAVRRGSDQLAEALADYRDEQVRVSCLSLTDEQASILQRSVRRRSCKGHPTRPVHGCAHPQRPRVCP